MSAIGVLSSFLSFVAGLWAATYLQDREVRRRHLGIVRALLAEVSRVHSEVGAKNEVYIAIKMFGNKPSIPTLAPWVQSLATDLASTDAAFLRLFMDLDRYLTNLRSADVIEDAAFEKVGLLKEAVDVHHKNKDLLGALGAEAEVKKVEQAADLASFAVKTDFNYVKSTLSDLKDQLGRLEKELEAGLRTHLPWKR